MIDLSSHHAIESAMFLKWEIPSFSSSYLSDYHTDVTIDGNVYSNIGNLLSISATSSELKASPSQLTISLSGIPNNSISNLLNNEIKGSDITLHRGMYNPVTHALLATGGDNPVMKYKGIVTNYAITDDVDPYTGIASTTITLTCNSMVEVLSKMVNGRRTNPVDFPDDSSMSRVQALANSNYNFGAP